jgi:hypothetical protein
LDSLLNDNFRTGELMLSQGSRFRFVTLEIIGLAAERLEGRHDFIAGEFVSNANGSASVPKSFWEGEAPLLGEIPLLEFDFEAVFFFGTPGFSPKLIAGDDDGVSIRLESKESDWD